MSRFINPFTDEGFKRIFGQEAHKGLLIDFLNHLLGGEHHIEDVTFMDKEQLPDNPDNRGLIYDVFCRTNKDENIIVEMQNSPQDFFKDRALMYLATAIAHQSKRGREGNDYKINAVYGVYFMNFRDSELANKFRTDVVLMDFDSHERFSDKLRMIFMQLPLFTKEESDCDNYFEKWIYLLKNMEILQRMPWAAQYAAFQQLAEVCETTALTPEERLRYEESIRIYRDNLAIASRQHREGLAEGEAKGRAEGRAEGEHIKAQDTARKMKSKGYPVEEIAEMTGLSIDEIEKV